jgi:hypothetical protein
MTDNFIQLKEDNILRLKIKTKDGKDTGNTLEFDLEDIEMPLKYQEMLEQDKKNKQWLKNQFLIIEKRQDAKGKKLFSRNEEDKIKAIQEFIKKEAENYNNFLGENGVQKLLNGRNLGWMTLNEIDEIIDKQIAPYFTTTMDDITKKIKDKYKVEKTNSEILK